MSTTFAFGDPKPSPDNYNNFSQAVLKADSSVKASSVIQKIPPPRVNPPVMSLDSVLGDDTVAQIQKRVAMPCSIERIGSVKPTPGCTGACSAQQLRQLRLHW